MTLPVSLFRLPQTPLVLPAAAEDHFRNKASIFSADNASLSAWARLGSSQDIRPIVQGLKANVIHQGYLGKHCHPEGKNLVRGPAGAKDDSRDVEVLADALRTDRRAFRKLALAEPLLIELREWSRMTDDLSAEKNRLANRLREQLWPYFPAMLDLEQDVAAEWFLNLWELAPTPARPRAFVRPPLPRS